MRAARGNTVAAAAINRATAGGPVLLTRTRGEQVNGVDPDTDMTVCHWNGRAFDVTRSSVEARAKAEWWMAELEAARPAVAFVSETMGDVRAFRGLRKLLKRKGYHAVLLPGSDEGCRNGILAAVDTKQGQIRSHSRLAERVFGLLVLHRGEASESAYTYTHGVAGAAFCKQVSAVDDFLTAAGGGLAMGDFNHVPCTLWRAAQPPLDRADRSLRVFCGWRCDCCEAKGDATNAGSYVVGGDGGLGEGRSDGWTRYETTNRVWGAPTSRIDLAVSVGSGAFWAPLPASWPDTAAEHAQSHAVSDHLMQWATRARAKAGIERQTRQRAPDLRKTAEGRELAAAITDSLADGADLVEQANREIALARRRGQSRADVAVSMVAHATQRAQRDKACDRTRTRQAVRGRRGGCETPRGRLLTAKANLQEVARLRRRGIHAMDADRSRIFHPSAGYRKYRLRAADGWQLVIRRLRRQLEVAQKELKRRSRSDTPALVEKAHAWAALPEHATAEKAKLAFDMVRKPRAAAVLTHIREHDRANGRRVSTMSAEAPAMMGRIGAANVLAVDDGAVPAACEAWHDKFVGQWEELRGAAGGAWRLREEVPFGAFRRLVRCMKVKAAGRSGVAVSQLRLAQNKALRLLYDALMSDADGDEVSDRWHQVLYVLIEKKPPNNPELASERREIALTEHDSKVILQCVRRACYARVLGRARRQNLGWLPGYSCSDVGMASGWAAQQARQLKTTLYMLFADLSQFFPRVNRKCLRVAELAHGIPKQVLALAAAIYGSSTDDPRVASCVYDSAGGFSDAFPNGMGVLMGCPLSTDRARLFLNSIVCAIELTAKGIRLWGSNGARNKTAWRRVSQLMNADDWCGIFEDEAELRKAWKLWAAWEPLTGAKVGIKAADKTVLTGVHYDADGRPSPVPDPCLRTVDGRQVPLRPPEYAYKHLGRWRRADGSVARMLAEFRAAFNGALRRLRAMRGTATRYQFLLVSAALIGGAADHYLQDTFISFDEADALEAKWRRVFNSHVKRPTDTPRAEIYEHKWQAGRTRRHLYSHGLVALYSAVNNALADVADLDHRALARSGLALSMYKWGCRGDPLLWNWDHLEQRLLDALRHKHDRFYGDAWLYAVIQLRKPRASADGDDDDAVEDADGLLWRWAMPPSDDDPMSGATPHFGSTTPTIFDSGAVEPQTVLIHAGYVTVAHFCSGCRDKWRWKSFQEAVSLAVD